MNAEEDALVAEQVVRALCLLTFSPVNVSPESPPHSPMIVISRRAERELTEVLVQMRDRCCVCGEILSLDELLDPMAEHEDLDAQYRRFSDGKEGVAKILEYMKTSGADGDEGEEEEPAEVEFDFDKKEVLAAV
ncbi:hypothetical protein B0H14DRAFT_3429320 [Mycena olivaceomarginata]|nr:hypothetical protein B0H14DRAFT_3429320 [Mycena olivaceomarginata]